MDTQAKPYVNYGVMFKFEFKLMQSNNQYI